MTEPRPEIGDEERWVGTMPRGWGKLQRNGLVLSGGGLKFAVHAGLFNRMEILPWSETTPVPNNAGSGPSLIDVFDCVVGTSAGSLLAAAIACGFCAEDVERFSRLFSQPSFQSYILDPNWLGAGSFLLRGDLGYVKGLYRGEAIQRTLSVFFSHNFLIGLGELYQSFAQQKKDFTSPEFDTALGDMMKSLMKLPLEKLPQMLDEISDRRHPKPVESGNGPSLRLITFQDINPGVRVPYERYMNAGVADWQTVARQAALDRLTTQQGHATAYRAALTAYYTGRQAAGRYIPPAPDNLRPMLLIIGTDLITGQKTVFSNYNLFEKELVYSKDSKVSHNAEITYRYINPRGQLSPLPDDLSEDLRPANYLYKCLEDGLPVSWAVRSSLSIPGVFAPQMIRYRDDYGVARTDFFIDGGVTDNYALQVAADWNIGRCQRILGGNIGNLGPRVHDYQARSILDVMLRTLLIQGDGNVDANAEDSLLNNSAVTTINELTPTDVTSIRELKKIPQLLIEGGQLADQFFTSFRQPQLPGQPVALNLIFGDAGSYIVFLPRIETYGMPPGTLAPPPAPVTDLATQVSTGSSEVDRIDRKDDVSPAQKSANSRLRSEQLGKIESSLTPSQVLGPGGILLGPFDNPAGYQPLPVMDLFNWLRRVVLIIALGFLSMFGVGLWRVTMWGWDALGWFKPEIQQFDSWDYWPLLALILLAILWNYTAFLRAIIFDFWVGGSARVVRRALEVPIGIGLYLLPLYFNQQMAVQSDPWYTLVGLIMISISTGALFFAIYSIIAFVVSLTRFLSQPNPKTK